MKGVGRVSGWKVVHRLKREIRWKNIRTGKEVAFWSVGKYGYEIDLHFPSGKPKVIKTIERVRKIAKKFMLSNQ